VGNLGNKTYAVGGWNGVSYVIQYIGP